MAKRISTAIVALVIALLAILANNPLPFVALMTVVCVIGFFEVVALTKISWVSALVFTLLSLLVPVGLQLWFSGGMHGFFILWLAGIIGLLVWKPNNTIAAHSSLLWMLGAGASAVVLQWQSVGTGSFVPNLLLLAIAPLWVGDSAAYFIGKKWGKKKLAPKISPNKTVEGAIANFFGCLLAAIALGYWLGESMFVSIHVGLATGIFGQLGDLLQSHFKRKADAKDSGTLLPGHGGILDRLDSFFLSCYPSLIILLFLSELFHVEQWPSR